MDPFLHMQETAFTLSHIHHNHSLLISPKPLSETMEGSYFKLSKSS
jgi:hypothetical protein